MGHENETVEGAYSKMKEDVAFRLEQAETVAWISHFRPRSPMLSVLSVKTKQNLQWKTRRNLLNREGKEWSGRMDLNHRPPGPEPGALARLRYAPTMRSGLSDPVRARLTD
jgi:hypothetical protein